MNGQQKTMNTGNQKLSYTYNMNIKEFFDDLESKHQKALYRQIQIFYRDGVKIPTGDHSDWTSDQISKNRGSGNNFSFSITLPGKIKDQNADTINNETNMVYWEFDFNDIATNPFNMYAHSVVINNLRAQLVFVILMLSFIRLLWKRKQNKK